MAKKKSTNLTPAPAPTPAQTGNGGNGTNGAKERPPLPEGIGTEAMVLPTRYLPLSQLKQHPDNAKWRMYPESRVKELDEVITERPEDAAIHPLGAIPSGETTEDGKPIYYVVDGNHQLEIYQRQGWEGAPVILKDGLSPADQVTVMVTSNRVKPLTPLEIGRAYQLYAEASGGAKKQGRQAKTEDGKASMVEFAKKIGVDRTYVSICVQAAELFASWSNKTKKKVTEAEDRFTTRHFKALRKLKDPRDRERFALWCVSDENTIGSGQLEHSISLFTKTIDASTYAKLLVGDLVEEPAPAAPINIPPQPGTRAGTTGAVAVGAGRGGTATAPSPGTVDRDEAFRRATTGGALGEQTEEEKYQDCLIHIEKELPRAHDSLLDIATNELSGTMQTEVQRLTIAWLRGCLSAWESLPLRLSLGDDVAGQAKGAEADEPAKGAVAV